jgi:hypothetical protein
MTNPERTTMRIKVLQSIASAHWDYQINQIVDVPMDRARAMIHGGLAVETDEALRHDSPSLCAMGHESRQDLCRFCRAL